MDLTSWLILITVSFVFIALAFGLFVLLTFIHNSGATYGIGILFCLLLFALVSVFAVNWSQTIWQAVGIAAGVLFFLLCLAVYFFLPHINNDDLVSAFRPLILFSLVSGFLIVVANLAKIILIT
jgi:hypothetical protein